MPFPLGDYRRNAYTQYAISVMRRRNRMLLSVQRRKRPLKEYRRAWREISNREGSRDWSLALGELTVLPGTPWRYGCHSFCIARGGRLTPWVMMSGCKKILKGQNSECSRPKKVPYESSKDPILGSGPLLAPQAFSPGVVPDSLLCLTPQIQAVGKAC